jgi:hypothetical protein
VNREYGHDTQGVTGVTRQQHCFWSLFGENLRSVIIVSNAVRNAVTNACSAVSNAVACGLHELENVCP